MDKVPKAEDYLRKTLKGEEGMLRIDQVAWLMNQHAQRHVKAALKAVQKRIDQAYKDKDTWPDEESILSAYPETLIQ